MVLLKPEDKIISQIAVNCLHGKSQSWLEDRVPLGIGLLPLGDHEGIEVGRGPFFLGFPYKDKSDTKAIKKV